MYGHLLDVGIAVYNAQEKIRNRAPLPVRVDEGTAPALERGKLLDRARVVVGDRVHAKIAEHGSGRALNFDKERKFVTASKADRRRLSIHASD